MFLSIVIIWLGTLLSISESVDEFFLAPPKNAEVLKGSDAIINFQGPKSHNYLSIVKNVTGEEPKLIAINGEPINKTGKYNLDGKYRLTIYDVSLEDAGEYIYTAKLIIPDNELGLIFETSVSANLTVRVAPTRVNIFWPGYSPTVKVNVETTLTCEAYNSRPTARFRWMHGSRNLTDLAEMGDIFNLRANGYGDSSSVLNVTLTEEDEGSTIRCLIDVGGIDSAADRAILVSLENVAAPLHQTQITTVASLLAFHLSVLLLG